ncbi:MAG: ABC transporter permease [Chloroflexota bacterium]
MINQLLRRLTLLPIILFVASLIIFLLPYATGVDPTMAVIRARVGERVLTAESIERLRTELDMDRSLPVLYTQWVGRLISGDMGFSYVSRTPVGTIIGRGLRVTGLLSSIALLLAIVLALPLGIWAAMRPGSWIDMLVTLTSQIGVAIPQYVMAPLLILVFAVWAGWLPSAGWRGPQFMILPALTLTMGPLPYLTQTTRAAMLDVLNADYIRTARGKGLSTRRIIYGHALRNALIPVVTLIAIWLAGLLGGSVIVEVIFSIPGLGRILYDAVLAGDIPLVQAGLMVIVTMAIVINTLTDLIYIVLNPALRTSEGGA